MTPSGIVLTFCLVLLVLSQPRRTAALGIIATAGYLSEGQVVNVVAFHFTSIRFVLLAGLIKVVASGDLMRLRLNKIDRCLIVYGFTILTISTLRSGTDNFIYQLGCLYNFLLSYFVFRCLLKDDQDFQEVLAKSAYLIIPLALLMAYESATGTNLFSLFDRVDAASWIRDGNARAAATFRNPITAGAFGTNFAMLFATMLFARTRTRAALVGLVAAMLIVISAHSSGPVLGLALGLLALACWPLRQHTRTLRWGIVLTLVTLQIVMKSPVWFLIARVSDLVGGGGWHRAYLIDQFINHFSSWWLAGTDNTKDWFPYHLPGYGTSDITNQFVSDGINAGLLGMFLSVMLLVRCFQRLGAAMSANRGFNKKAASKRALWGIGSTLVGNIGILFSITYMDQMIVIWCFLLACIAGIDLRKRANGLAELSRNNQAATPRGALAGST